MVLYITCDDLRILKINNTVKAFKKFWWSIFNIKKNNGVLSTHILKTLPLIFETLHFKSAARYELYQYYDENGELVQVSNEKCSVGQRD